MEGLRRHLSYANIVATLALIFAMGRGAFAARHYVINSTRQINPKVLKKLRGAEGSVGPTGPRGEPGADGTNGATNVVVRSADKKTPAGGDGFARAECKPGERAKGGGETLIAGSTAELWYFDPGGRPIFEAGEEGPPPKPEGRTPVGWLSGWANDSGAEVTIRVYVVCAKP
jgi:hypothetical protein